VRSEALRVTSRRQELSPLGATHQQSPPPERTPASLTPAQRAAKRACHRLRRVAATAVASALAAVVQTIVALVTVRVCLAYLGTEEYGLWMAIASTTAMLAFADFGMGNGLLNAIAAADGRNDVAAATAATSSAVLLLTGIGTILAILLAVSYPFMRWDVMFRVSGPLSGMAPRVMAITLGCAVLALPLGIVQRLQLGQQRGYLNGIWSGVGSLLGFAGLLVAIRARATLPWLALSVAGAPVVALLLNAVALFGVGRPGLRPRIRAASVEQMRSLLGAGFLFFAIQLAGITGYQLPTLVVAHLLGPSAVTTLMVPFRLFMLMPGFAGFFLTPLWPAYREALERGDASWVSRTVRRSAIICLAGTAAWSVILVFLGPLVLRWWVGSAVVAPMALRVGLAAWATLTGLGGPIAMFLNGAGALRFQALCAWLMAVASVALCLVLIPRFGVAGVPFAMVAAQAVFIIVPSLLFVPRLLSRLTTPMIAATAD